MSIMKKATTLFTAEEIKNIEQAISSVEEATSAEVVPVVATVSGRYDRAEDMVGLILALITVAIVWGACQGVNLTGEDWTGGAEVKLGLWTILAIFAGVFIGGVILANHVPMLRLLLIAKGEMQEEVEARARETFQTLKIRSTENATGILIYVSLYEQMVRVVGDDAISEKLSQSDWTSLCETIINGFKSGDPAGGIRNGILRSGELLAQHFPKTEGNQNELNDTLHLLD